MGKFIFIALLIIFIYYKFYKPKKNEHSVSEPTKEQKTNDIPENIESIENKTLKYYQKLLEADMKELKEDSDLHNITVSKEVKNNSEINKPRETYLVAASSCHYSICKKKESFLNKSEKPFYEILTRQASLKNIIVFSKVRLIDFINYEDIPNDSNCEKVKIALMRRHIDFLLCKNVGNNVSVLAGIELDGSSHNINEDELYNEEKIKKKENDEIKNKIFYYSKIPLYRVPVGTVFKNEIHTIIEDITTEKYAHAINNSLSYTESYTETPTKTIRDLYF